MKFLAATGQSAKGMYDTFKRLSDQILFAAHNADPYMQSHPMPAERVAALELIAKNSPNWDKKDPPELQVRHDMMRAKLSGFLDRGDTVARRYPLSDTSLPARYARAIATYRHADLRVALAQIDGLIQAQPNNPYFHELKGQALLEGGKPAEAIAPLRRAIQLAPQPGADPGPAGAGAERHQRTPRPPTRRSRCCASRLPTSPNRWTATRSSPWPMDAKATSRRPISPRRSPHSCAATIRPRASLRRAPRPASRSARPVG